MLPISPEAYRAAGWTRRTRTESFLLMELFLPLHLQFEQPFSYLQLIVRIGRWDWRVSDSYRAQRLPTRWRSFLNDTYLPVAVLPALIAFPKNCERKD
jgi:hypothetical protein